MDIVQALASNPLPTSIAVVIAVAAILGYYFFVIPLIDDHKKLKEKSKAQEEELSVLKNKGDERFISQLDEINLALSTIRSSFEEGDTDRLEKFKKIEAFVAESGKYQSDLHHSSVHLQSQIAELSMALKKMSEDALVSVNSSKVRDETMDRLLTEVNRNMYNINEKQSQILGALLGMGRIQDRNKGI
jgi:hypothetical protein